MACRYWRFTIGKINTFIQLRVVTVAVVVVVQHSPYLFIT